MPRTYRIRQFTNSQGSKPTTNYSLTLPNAVADAIIAQFGDEVIFECHITDEGVLYVPAEEEPEAEIPESWNDKKLAKAKPRAPHGSKKTAAAKKTPAKATGRKPAASKAKATAAKGKPGPKPGAKTNADGSARKKPGPKPGTPRKTAAKPATTRKPAAKTAAARKPAAKPGAKRPAPKRRTAA